MNFIKIILITIVIIIFLYLINSGEKNRLEKIRDIAGDEKPTYLHHEDISDSEAVKLLSNQAFKTLLNRAEFILPTKYSAKRQSPDSHIKLTTKVDIIVSTSSFLKEGEIMHNGYKAFDSNLKTIWVEGVQGFGFKEWIKFDMKSKKGIGFEYVIIYPGYGKSEKLFYENNRVKSLILKSYTPTSGSISEENVKFDGVMLGDRLKFKDENKYHVFLIADRFMGGENLQYTFFIEDVYKGSKYNDTCISEIIFIGFVDLEI